MGAARIQMSLNFDACMEEIGEDTTYLPNFFSYSSFTRNSSSDFLTLRRQLVRSSPARAPTRTDRLNRSSLSTLNIEYSATSALSLISKELSGAPLSVNWATILSSSSGFKHRAKKRCPATSFSSDPWSMAASPDALVFCLALARALRDNRACDPRVSSAAVPVAQARPIDDPVLPGSAPQCPSGLTAPRARPASRSRNRSRAGRVGAPAVGRRSESQAPLPRHWARRRPPPSWCKSWGRSTARSRRCGGP